MADMTLGQTACHFWLHYSERQLCISSTHESS